MPALHIEITQVVSRALSVVMALMGGAWLAGSARAVYVQPPSPTCATKSVLVTLAREQISYCAPTALKYNVVEDNASDQYSSYAALDQLAAYASINIKSTMPGYAPGIGRPTY